LFLKHLHLISYDLNTSTSQAEAWIKTLLAHTASGHDKVAVATHTWTALLELVASGMPHAASYTREALPSAILASHTPVGSSDHDALRALHQHGVPVFQNIRTIIGVDCHLPRDEVETRLLTTLAQHRIVVVAGPAGSGKSAVAKSVVQGLADGCLTLAFRAEEFAHPHLDRALLDSQIPLNTVQLTAILAGQGRKLLLIESVERLLEASVRDAFSDLLHLIQGDSSWSVVLTCRDYSLDVVRSSFLQSTGLPHAIVDVPPLSEAEIEAVTAAVPALARPASNPGLRLLFQNPYILDKASRMTWPETATLPQDERTFRQKLWREVVRDESVATNALPRRRGQVFIELALRRARTLERYAPCGDLDPQALQGLRQNDLIEFSRRTDTLASPAHDVLEDWAILEWLEQTAQQSGGTPASLANAVDAYPALRRAYRKWLGEFLECHAQEAGQFVFAVFQDQSLPSHFRDDTVVSALLASTAPRFVQQHEHLLLADDAQLLRRLIHLLRVACKTTPAWLGLHDDAAPVFFVPHGTAWAAVLALIARNITALVPRDIPLLVGLLEDWGHGISRWSPYPAGADDAARVAFHLLPFLDDYRSEEHRKDVLKVIVKVPKAASALFLQLVERARANDRRDRAADDLAELLLEDMGGYAAAHDFPEAVIQLAQERFCLRDNEEDLRNDFFHSSIELEPFFGLRGHLHFDYFPPSAIRGPFFALLRSHPRQVVPFVVGLLNHCIDWYANPRLPGSRIEPPRETQVRLTDGTSVTQWCNPRLWQLYRGTSVGPYVLQCALMALEHWLLELCDTAPQYVEQWLLKLLRDANNVCVTGVVASIATAHPRLVGAAGVALLTCRDLVLLDRVRLVHEAERPSALSGMLPSVRADNAVYEDERKRADALPHRKLDLETMALNLQLTPHRDRVWQILDEHRQALPSVDDQTEDDRIWRLALHRMDIRNYAPADPQPAAAIAEAQPPQSEAESPPTPTAEPRRILFEMHLPDRDLRAMVEEQSPIHQARDAQGSLFMWGISVFQREDKPFANPADWQTRLAQARQADEVSGTHSPADRIRMLDGAPAIVAAVCLRDHWDEMSRDERKWCIEIVCWTVEQDWDTDDELIRVSSANIDASRPSAFVLSAILTHDIPDETRERVLDALGAGLGHAVDQVIAYAAEGVGFFLSARATTVAETCLGALAMRANLLDALVDRERARPFPERTDSRQLERHVAPQVRAAVLRGIADWNREYAALRLDRWYGRHAIPLLFAILSYIPENPVAKAFFVEVAQLISEWWGARESPRSRRNRREDDRPIELEHECLDRLARVLLRMPASDAADVCAPILDAIDPCPREAAMFLLDLIGAEDRLATKAPFWDLWQAFANRIVNAQWISRLGSRHSGYEELIHAAFFVLPWRKGFRHWPGLEGFAQKVDSFFEQLPPCAIVLDSYVRFLYHIGEQSLPRAFEVAAGRLQQGNAREMLSESNTIFCLQVLLARFVYGNPHHLKSDPRMRAAVLYLLDELVESGSSAAYRTRDDFVTPIGPSSARRSSVRQDATS
jgi:gluconate kinase